MYVRFEWYHSQHRTYKQYVTTCSGTVTRVQAGRIGPQLCKWDIVLCEMIAERSHTSNRIHACNTEQYKTLSVSK